MIYVCEDCGKKPEPINKEGNWYTYPVKCPDCGGKITIKWEDI